MLCESVDWYNNMQSEYAQVGSSFDVCKICFSNNKDTKLSEFSRGNYLTDQTLCAQRVLVRDRDRGRGRGRG